MYPELFGITGISAYELIGVCGYVILWLFSFSRYAIAGLIEDPSVWMLERQAYHQNRDRSALRKRCLAHWAKKEMLMLTALHTVMFTFGGNILGQWIGRSTDFYGYVLLTALAVVLASVALGGDVRTRLDSLAATFFAMAAFLKLGCFCAGCCYGLPWAYGFYNENTQQHEFPIQLVEMAVYVLLFFVVRWRFRGRKGEGFAFFLVVYSSFRFIMQFFRGDEAVFSVFHWVSATVCLLGILYWLLIRYIPFYDRQQSV